MLLQSPHILFFIISLGLEDFFRILYLRGASSYVLYSLKLNMTFAAHYMLLNMALTYQKYVVLQARKN